jgi:hypothetical protein
VTSATEVTTQPTRRSPQPDDVAPDPPDGDDPPGAAAPDAGPPPRSRAERAARAVGFHALAIVLFALPAVVLWWHVWTGHPASTLTCACGDPAQEVWFMAWPAWAIVHLHNPFFSGVVNVPDGANLLSNTSGTLVGVVLAPVTWAFGPVVSTNVALTLAPALSAWACFVAIRPLVTWKAGAAAAALVFGYSAALVGSLVFGHVSVTMLVVPPLLFTTLHEIVIRQEHSVRRDGVVLAALLVVQFLISPEVLVMCLMLAVVGLVAVAVVGWRQVVPRAGHALPAVGLGAGLALVLLAYPAWFGLAGPQAVTGVLFVIAPLTGVAFSGILSPGQFRAAANAYVRLGGYLGHLGPQPDYLGPGAAAALVAVVLARRRALTWLLVLLTAATLVLCFGPYLIDGPGWLAHVWLPWRVLGNLPVLKEILPDQLAPLITLFLAFLFALGLDAIYVTHRRPGSWLSRRRAPVTAIATVALVLVAVVPVLATFDVPLTVSRVVVPPYLRRQAPALPSGTVLLTIPFAVSGSSQPMLWQAVGGMRFRLAGAALKTPNAAGGPVDQGTPGSARRILSDLTIVGEPQPSGTVAQLRTVRRALVHWQVGQVVIAGESVDPIYASGFFTKALGVVPAYTDRAWVFTLSPGWTGTTPAFGVSLAACRGAAGAPGARANPLSMSTCVLFAAGRT